MREFYEYLFKISIVLLKIGAVLFIIGAIIYFSLTTYLDYRTKKVEERENIMQIQKDNEKAEYDKLHAGDKVEREKSEKEAAYSACLNKAYKEFKAKYDEECSKFIMDGQCQVKQEKLYEFQGFYMFDKKQCEKLK